jgi:two-component system, NtrC family, sensor kinase
VSVRRIVVGASSTEEAEAARELLETKGARVEAVVVEPDPSPPIAAEAGGAEPDPHHLERLATLGTLAAGTAHEVNNLLTHLLATLYDASRTLTWLDQADGDAAAPRARLRRDVDGALESCYQLRTLARGITQYSSLGGAGVMDTDLESLLDEALQIAGPELRRRAQIERTFHPATPRVRVNPSRICQVFVNLLTNAAHAIAARGGAAPGKIRISAMLDGERARVDIADTGCGIGPAAASRIFEPFFTTKTDEAGTGLGLPVSRAIIDEHGGELSFTSEVGEGTTFSVHLPPLARREN